MILEVNDKFRFVGVWLTKDEIEHGEGVSEFCDQMEAYRQKKYKLVIYHSGNADLLPLTCDLLSHNKKIINDEKHQVENIDDACYNVIKQKENVENDVANKTHQLKKVR